MALLEKRSPVVFVVVLLLFMASSPAYALYVIYRGAEVTWSNTKLGGGPFQPIGWVQVPDVAPKFTGDIFAQDFISVSSVVIYGSYETVTWGPEHLHPLSKVSFQAGKLTDINLVFYDPGNERLLVASGPPTPNAVLVNTPRPPCVHWPSFEDLDFCGARVAIQILTTAAVEPAENARVTTPRTPKPTYAARADVRINGSLEFNANGGLLFDNPYSHLNAYGPYLLTTTLEWQMVHVDEPQPHTQRVWFTKVLINHQASGQTIDGKSFNFLGDDDFWALGEPLAWVKMNAFTLENISEFCAELSGIGICDLRGDFLLNGGSLIFGVFDSNSPASVLLDGVGDNFLLDLSRIVGLAQLSTTFAGSLAHRAVPVPVLELQAD